MALVTSWGRGRIERWWNWEGKGRIGFVWSAWKDCWILFSAWAGHRAAQISAGCFASGDLWRPIAGPMAFLRDEPRGQLPLDAWDAVVAILEPGCSATSK